MMNTLSTPRHGFRLHPLVASWLALAAVAAVDWSAPRASAAPPMAVENIRLGFGTEDVFKIGAWTPVRVQVKGGDAPFRGFLDVVVADDDGTPTSVQQVVDVPAGETRTYIAYVRPGGRDAGVVARFRSETGRRIGERSREQISRIDPVAIAPDENWILSFGRPQGLDQVTEVAGFRRKSGGGEELRITSVEPSFAPGLWLAYDGAHSLVLDTADHDVLEMLAGPRGEAIVDWVRRGGHLVVAVGENWQALLDSALGPVLPALPTGRERLQSLEAFDTFAGSTSPITPPGSPANLATRFTDVEARGGRSLASVAGLPLVVRGPLEFGRITMIGVDFDQKVFGAWADRGLFWVQALDLKRARVDDDSSVLKVGGSARFYETGVTDLASQLRVALEQFPRVKLVSFGLVAFLIFLYILAIGPGDYFFLKRFLKRMELTWITFPLIVAGVSLLAYLAAYRLKGNDLLVNKVDVLDVDQVAGKARGRSIATLFSPQNRDYDLAFIPSPIDGGDDSPVLAPVSTDGPPRPPAGVEMITSWFGIPESRFGGMGGASGFSFISGGGYAYGPTGGRERLEHVRIPIWSTKTVTARWYGPASPIVESDLRLAGFDRLSGTIENLQSYPLTDALLAFGRQVYILRDIAPGQSMRVELQSDRNLSGELRERANGYLRGKPQPGAVGEPARLDRGDLLYAAMFHESESRRVGQDQPLNNSTLSSLDLTGQLTLQRPMLVARIQGPAAQIAIGNAPTEPLVDQTTVIRVVLPLKNPDAAVAAVAPGQP